MTMGAFRILKKVTFGRVLLCVFAASFFALVGCGKIPPDVVSPVEGGARPHVYPDPSTDPRP